MIFKELNIEGFYHLFEIDKNNLREAIYGLSALGVKGVNVTIPYKIDIVKYLHSVSKEADKIGAVNTIGFEKGQITGYNTDYLGFGMLLDKNNISINNEAIVILGTGGVSKAVVQYAIDNNAKEIIFVSRDAIKGKERYPDFEVIEYSDLKHHKASGIIVNCTPVGMYPEVKVSPIDKGYFDKFHTAVDLIYNPIKTEFLKEAKKQGLKTVNGLYMLIGQAIKAQEIWNNTDISNAITERIYREIKIFHSRR